MRRLTALTMAGAFCLSLLSAADTSSPQLSLPKNALQLHASNATVHGKMLRYEPETNKNCLGYWTEAGDWASWQFKVAKSGDYWIEVWQGCGKGQGGSDVKVEVAGKEFFFVVEETGHFQNFKPRRLGPVRLKKGNQTLAVKPQNKKAKAIMDIRRILLLPVKSGEKSRAG